MGRAYRSEADKVRDQEHIMQYVKGNICDLGCGDDKITPDAFGIDGRDLPGVNYVTDNPYDLDIGVELCASSNYPFDTVFSSHFLEHLANQYGAIKEWSKLLKPGGHLVLYLPEGEHYNNRENPEHIIDMKQSEFVFWFTRAFCGEGKDFRGNNLPAIFELVHQGADVFEPDHYSFFIAAKKL